MSLVFGTVCTSSPSSASCAIVCVPLRNIDGLFGFSCTAQHHVDALASSGLRAHRLQQQRTFAPDICASITWEEHQVCRCRVHGLLPCPGALRRRGTARRPLRVAHTPSHSFRAHTAAPHAPGITPCPCPSSTSLQPPSCFSRASPSRPAGPTRTPALRTRRAPSPTAAFRAPNNTSAVPRWMAALRRPRRRQGRLALRWRIAYTQSSASTSRAA